MDTGDLELRNRTYQHIVQSGRAPSAAEMALVTGMSVVEVGVAWRRLHAAHALVLDPAGEIRMLNPFSAVPTPFRVRAGERTWFANCGWDAFGVGAALDVDTEIHTTCGDCGEPITIRVRDRKPDRDDLVWHVLVPARDWWQDIGHT